MRFAIFELAAFSLVAALGGNGGCTRPAEAPRAEVEQTVEGEALYAEHCARCHGAAGAGGDKAPAIVGNAALPLEPPPAAKVRREPFHTAKDVLDFVQTSMPADRPGSLTADESGAIVAFVLHATGVDLEHRRVTGGTASTFVLHSEPAKERVSDVP
ncbi:MAG TPA: c-type cytochrome [Byssovorax sp.]